MIFEIHINDPVAYEWDDEELSDEALLDRARANLSVEEAEPEFYIEGIAHHDQRAVYAHQFGIQVEEDNANVRELVEQRVTNTAQSGRLVDKPAMQLRPSNEVPNFEPTTENTIFL